MDTLISVGLENTTYRLAFTNNVNTDSVVNINKEHNGNYSLSYLVPNKQDTNSDIRTKSIYISREGNELNIDETILNTDDINTSINFHLIANENNQGNIDPNIGNFNCVFNETFLQRFKW